MSSDEKNVGNVVTEGQSGYKFFRRPHGRVLIRKSEANGHVHRLVDGYWVRDFHFHSFDPQEWQKLGEKEMRNHVRRFVIPSLVTVRLSWWKPIRRGKRAALWRWLVPPPRGGTSRRQLDHDAVERSRASYERMFREVSGEDLTQLEEQSLLGFEHQRQRGSGAEQRANFFLGAAGLTTTLILTNASFLIGDKKLDEPWLALAAVSLGIASLCALVCGGRALQAAMLTFSRTPPNAVTRIVRRRDRKGEDLRRIYVASLLVAQARTSVVGDWKISRLSEAREWFLGVILGAVALSACVLLEVFLG